MNYMTLFRLLTSKGKAIVANLERKCRHSVGKLFGIVAGLWAEGKRNIHRFCLSPAVEAAPLATVDQVECCQFQCCQSPVAGAGSITRRECRERRASLPPSMSLIHNFNREYEETGEVSRIAFFVTSRARACPVYDQTTLLPSSTNHFLFFIF